MSINSYGNSRLDPLNDAALLLGVTHVFVLMLVSCVSMSRSVAVRVEDYEAYYKRQKADSNCGFAEEFEVKHKAIYSIIHMIWIFHQAAVDFLYSVNMPVFACSLLVPGGLISPSPSRT